MKIAILSMYYYAIKYENYGSALQYYALQEFLRKNGHSAYWIRYIPENNGWTRFRKIRKVFSIRSVFNFIKWRWRELSGLSYSRGIDKFINKNSNLSDIEYRGIEELKANPPLAEAYIVGSDQVWANADDATFLNFGGGGVKRIAYAPSSKWGHNSSDWYRVASQNLKRFNAVSVREEQGIQECIKAGRMDVIQVLDPTFLLNIDDYKKISSSTPSLKSFMLGYFLNITRLGDIPWHEFSDYADENLLDLKVIPLQGAEKAIPKKNIVIPTVEEWLGLYFSSECVVTNSFHGTVFAIKLQKPFLVILQNGSTSSENSRFISLLKSLGLEHRIFNSKSNRSFSEQMNDEIPWNKVRDRVDSLVKVSEKYLLESLSGTGTRNGWA